MRSIVSLIVVTAIAAPVLAQTAGDTRVTLRIGDATTPPQTTTSVTFARVSDDSRCPAGAQCIWAGDATVTLRVQPAGGDAQLLALHTANADQRTAEAAGLRITLERLEPVPRVDGRLDPASYAVRLVVAVVASPPPAQARTTPYDPEIGLAGKDVVWVPTPPALVERMLDLAAVTSSDVVMDLGSGDGRNVIAAARRGARAIGIEYNPDLVALSMSRAQQAGVAGRATFREGDMFTADVSKATVLALFLLPDNLERLGPTFLAMPPGTRIVLNTFTVPEWLPDETATLPECEHWCTALLYYVPAQAAGRWLTSRGELTLSQGFQIVAGTLVDGNGTTKVEGRLRGGELTLTIDGETLRATVDGDRLQGGLTGSRVP